MKTTVLNPVGHETTTTTSNWLHVYQLMEVQHRVQPATSTTVAAAARLIIYFPADDTRKAMSTHIRFR